MSFNTLALLPAFDAFYKEQGYKEPTAVQRKVVPALLARKSVVVVSETGSGKTLSYVLPLMHMLKAEELAHGGTALKSTPRAIILAPTRELAGQIYDVMKSVSHHVKLRVRLLTGGDSHAKTKSLGHSVYDILVATPSRVKSAMKHKELSLGHVRTFILDEADNLFEMGFKKDIELMLEAADLSAMQMGFFTATLPPAFDEFMTTRFEGKKIERVHFDASHRPQSLIQTYNVRVDIEEKDRVVRMFLEKEAKGRGIIFTNQRNQAEDLFKLMKTKMPLLKMRLLHGDMDIEEREDAINAFQNKKCQVLVATDVAARGIDIDDLMWVLNYGLPKTAIYYLHRCGRVGRGGKPGVVYNLVAPHDSKMIEAINEAIRGQSHLQLEGIPAEKVKRQMAPGQAKKPQVRKPQEMKREVRSTDQKSGRNAARTAGHQAARKATKNRMRRVRTPRNA